MNVPDTLLILNAAATWSMVGLIWFVHRVHYPMFDRYTRDDFADIASLHQRRTTGVVIGPMVIELVTAAMLVITPPLGVPAWQTAVGFALALVWAGSTAWLSVPIHRKLSAGFDATAHRRLITTNAVRTAAWTIRGLLVAVMLMQRLSS
ncbi:MAG TPA: hypothetical protein VGB55_02270 [Tepidisphaeraceae bacterium]|jgi:hypothetical protein